MRGYIAARSTEGANRSLPPRPKPGNAGPVNLSGKADREGKTGVRAPHLLPFQENALSATNDSLLTTPLNALHLELGARMVPFAGYSMPVQYPAGLMAEHQHTRTAAGLFDVSHMGQLRLVGADAAAAFESLMPVDVIDLAVGKQR